MQKNSLTKFPYSLAERGGISQAAFIIYTFTASSTFKHLEFHFAKIILIRRCYNLVHRREYFGKRKSAPSSSETSSTGRQIKQRESPFNRVAVETPKERKAAPRETNQIRQTLSSAYPVGGYRQLSRSRFTEPPRTRAPSLPTCQHPATHARGRRAVNPIR